MSTRLRRAETRSSFIPQEGTVKIWHAQTRHDRGHHANSCSLDRLQRAVSDPAQFLLPEELKSADRFRQPLARLEFMTARALLRSILSECLGVTPCRVALKKSRQGKPFLLEWANPDRLKFNVSHAQGHVMVAVARDVEIGVDVECVRELDAMDEVAQEFMTPEEAFLYDISGDRKPEMFFRVWTRKEAILKALGCGLLAPLKDTESLTRRVTAIRDGALGLPEPLHYYVTSFDAEPGVPCAVASCGTPLEICRATVR